MCYNVVLKFYHQTFMTNVAAVVLGWL